MSQKTVDCPADFAATVRRRLFVACAVLVLTVATVASYGNSLRGPLVLDDLGSIRENQTIRHLWPPGRVLRPPGLGATVDGRPVLNLSFAVNYAVGGLDVGGYHAVNLAIHMLAGWTLFGLMRRTLELPRLRARFGEASTALAFAIALLWLLHPLQTAAVTYVSQRAESLVGLWYLLTLYCAARGMTAGPGSRSDPAGARRLAWAWSIAAMVACGLGMGSKEVMVSAPLIVLLYDRMLVTDSWGELWRRRWGFYGSLAGTWVLLVYLVWLAGGRGGTAGVHSGVTPWHYLLTQCGAVVHYLGLAFWPEPLVFDYGRPEVQSLGPVLAQAVILLLLLAVTGWGLIHRWASALLGAAFFAILAPSSSVVPVTTQTMAEHRMYLPLVAVVSLVVLGLFAGGQRLLRWRPAGAGRANDSRPANLAASVMLPLVFAVAAGGLLGWRTLARNKDYRSEESIWRDTVAKQPDNWRAWNWLGMALLDRDDAAALQESRACFEMAVAAKPDFAEAYNNRGLACFRLDLLTDALGSFNKAIELDSQRAMYFNNRGNIFRQWHQYPQALADFDKAVSLDGGLADVYSNRSNVLRRLKRAPEAIADANRAIALNPDVPDYHLSRGNAYQDAGDYSAAIRDYDQVIAAAPGMAEAYFDRAVCRFHVGDVKLAWADVTQCRNLGGQIDPKFAAELRAALQHSP